MKYVMLLLLMMSKAWAAGSGVVYFDTNSKLILWQSAGPSLIGTSATNISTAPINFPLALGNVNYWDGSAPTLETPVQAQTVALVKIRRDMWELQLVKNQAIASGNVTAAELRLFDRDIELLQRRISAIQAGRQ